MIAMVSLVVSAQLAPPVVLAGTNRRFQEVVLQVEQHLSDGKFEPAAKAGEQLPRLQFTVEWDDAAVPRARRAEFEMALTNAIKAWKDEFPSLEVRRGKPANIKISFATDLPPAGSGDMPQGAVFLPSTAPSEPSVEAVIALSRERHRTPAEARDVAAEIAHAFGLYFGLERTPISGGVMGRTDLHVRIPLRLSPSEAALVEANLAVVKDLQSAIEKKQRMSVAKPRIAAQPLRLESQPAVQGDFVPLTMQVTNLGTGTLVFRLAPDCSCFTIRTGTRVKPGASELVQIVVDTSQFAGDFHKNLWLFSNDVDAPLRQVPVEFKIAPRYRFLRSEPGRTHVLKSAGETLEVFLDIGTAKPFEVESVSVAGIAGKVSYDRWQGSLPDEELGEPDKPRDGYRIRIALGGEKPIGRIPVTLLVKTTDKTLETLSYTLFVQSGIVALPSMVYFGQIGVQSRAANLVLSRPGEPFRIQQVTSTLGCLSVQFRAGVKGDEHRLTVTYDGKAPKGRLDATITVKTDDPTQPTIVIPVQGTVT